MKNQKKTIEELLSHADVHINGDRPWDIQVHNDQLYDRVLSQGSIGLGEAYMDNWWDCEQPDEFFSHVMRAGLQKKIQPIGMTWTIAEAYLRNIQRRAKAFEIAEKHYDIGNDLYEAMLDTRMTYTCGYWKEVEETGAEGLNAAQEAKLDLICRKIGLQKGMTVLDIGCGWGSFIQFAAERYGAQAVGITVSKEQVELGNKRCSNLPVEFRLQDYRELSQAEQFDRIVSIGMFEHVGYKNYRTFMESAHHALKDNGLFLLHTIGRPYSVRTTDPWINKYIFPNSMLPSIAQIGKAVEKLFEMEDWHNFGTDYDKTLMAWFENFHTAWSELKPTYNERFYRMWKYYLLSCAGTFRARNIHLWQIVLSKDGVVGGYTSIR